MVTVFPRVALWSCGDPCGTIYTGNDIVIRVPDSEELSVNPWWLPHFLHENALENEIEVKRFTENTVRFTIRSSFIFGSVRFIRVFRSFLLPLRQKKKEKKSQKKPDLPLL